MHACKIRQMSIKIERVHFSIKSGHVSYVKNIANERKTISGYTSLSQYRRGLLDNPRQGNGETAANNYGMQV